MFIKCYWFGSERSKGYWRRLPIVRAFLDNFAEIQGFDPLVPHNWERVTQKQILSTRVSHLPPVILLICYIHFLKKNKKKSKKANQKILCKIQVFSRNNWSFDYIFHSILFQF